MKLPSPNPEASAQDACFRLLVEQVQDYAIYLLDLDGHVISWNAGAERIKGYSAGEIIGRHFSCFYTQSDIDEYKPQAALDTAHHRGRFEDEGLRVRRDGSTFWAAVVITALYDESGSLSGFAKVTRDITERRQYESRLRQMVELAVNAMILIGADGRIVQANARTATLFGYQRDELSGLAADQLLPERFRRLVPGISRRFFAGPTTMRSLGRKGGLFGLRSGGSEFPIEIDLHLIKVASGWQIFASIVDVTDRRRSEELFRVAVESAPNAMVMTDADGRILMSNLETERMFGYRRDELLGQAVELLIPERLRLAHPQHRADFARQPSRRAMGVGRDLFGRRKDGSEFPIEIGLNPIAFDEGLLVLSAIVDITERRQAEHEARLHLAEVAHFSRLSTAGEMISGLAHEINQPLAAAKNFASAFMRLARSGSEVTNKDLIKLVENAGEQTSRACEIVTRLGNFLRKGPTERMPADLNSVIDQVMALTVPGLGIYGDGVTWRLELEPKLPPVAINAAQIQQVLLNLIRNGVEAMNEMPADERVLTIATAREADRVRVTVRDRGVGLSAEQITRVGEPFVTTKPNGMGLGLSISRSIVEDHGGTLFVESALGHGTTFGFTLRIAEYLKQAEMEA